MKYLKILLLAPLIVFPALAFALLFLSAPFNTSHSSFDNIWSNYFVLSIYALYIAYLGNTIIGFPIIFILNKFKRLNICNIFSCVLFLLLIVALNDKNLLSENFKATETLEATFWLYIGVFYFSMCVAITDYFIIKHKYDTSNM